MKPLKTENKLKQISLTLYQVVSIITQREKLFQVTLEHSTLTVMSLLEIWYKNKELQNSFNAIQQSYYKQ